MMSFGPEDDLAEDIALIAAGDPASPIGRTRSQHWVFVVVAVALFMSSIDTTIVATALPAIHRGLHTTINWAGWTITIYSLGNVVTLPIAGQISDHFGRRRVFFVAVAIFTGASLVCGFAPNIYVLIAFRLIQAAGAGALQPSGAGVIAQHYGAGRDRAIGLFGTIAASGQVLGPIFGGLIVGYLSWRWIFFVNIPIGVVLLVAIGRVVPLSTRTDKRKTDVRGLMLLAVCVFLGNLGITNLGGRNESWFSPIVVVPVVIALVVAVLFVQHTRHAAEPFIPMRFFRARGFAVVNTMNFLWGITGFGVASLIPLYAQDRYHFSALDSGTLLTARGLGAIAIGTLAAFSLRRTGYRMPLMVGYTIVGLGTLMMTFSPQWGIGPYMWLSIAGGISGFGSGLANPASRNASLQLAPDEVPAITGLRQMFVFIGITFSVSTVTAILNRAGDPGIVQAHILWVIAGLLVVVMVPLSLRIPEHRGNW